MEGWVVGTYRFAKENINSRKQGMESEQSNLFQSSILQVKTVPMLLEIMVIKRATRHRNTPA
jgi:hypothetical protein